MAINLQDTLFYYMQQREDERRQAARMEEERKFAEGMRAFQLLQAERKQELENMSKLAEIHAKLAGAAGKPAPAEPPAAPSTPEGLAEAQAAGYTAGQLEREQWQTEQEQKKSELNALLEKVLARKQDVESLIGRREAQTVEGQARIEEGRARTAQAQELMPERKKLMSARAAQAWSSAEWNRRRPDFMLAAQSGGLKGIADTFDKIAKNKMSVAVPEKYSPEAMDQASQEAMKLGVVAMLIRSEAPVETLKAALVAAGVPEQQQQDTLAAVAAARARPSPVSIQIQGRAPVTTPEAPVTQDPAREAFIKSMTGK